MPFDSVCAMIVAYHPGPEILHNIAALRAQVEHLVVVDNGSSELEVGMLKSNMSMWDFTLIELKDNYGIARALNVGAQWAQAHMHRWIIFFDQDSTVTRGFVDALLSELAPHEPSGAGAIAVPIYKDPVSGASITPSYFAKDGGPLCAMTSGSMMPVKIFSACGWFREDFFIDQVDHEFCFRARKNGYTIRIARNAILLHAPGHPKRHSFMGVRTFKATHHSAMRQYYIVRNGIVMVRDYWKIYPRWCYMTCKALILIPIRVICAETDRKKKLANIGRGVIDGMLRRMGKRTNL